MSGLPVHSPLGASSYDRWGASLGGCPGSIRLSKDVKKTTSVYAEAGTKAHEVAYAMLTGQPYAALPDQDEMDAVKTYVDLVLKYKQRYTTVLFESRFDLSEYYPMLYGTADCVLYNAETKELVVIDYKHGAGVPVEVVENSQLMYYGLGALTALSLPVSTVVLVIVQPRCFHVDGPVRKWETDAVRMLEFVSDLIEDAKLTADPNAPLITGDHCRWCPAQASCPAIQEKALVTAKQTFSPVIDYEPLKLSETLAMLPAIESWVKSVREFAYRESQHGRIPPGWKLVEKRAHRKWAPDVNADDLARILGLHTHEILDQKLKSPAQLEKTLKDLLSRRMHSVKAQQTRTGARNEENQQKLIWDQFNDHIIKESSGATLVPDADGRPALKLDASDIFDIVID